MPVSSCCGNVATEGTCCSSPIVDFILLNQHDGDAQMVRRCTSLQRVEAEQYKVGCSSEARLRVTEIPAKPQDCSSKVESYLLYAKAWHTLIASGTVH